MINTDFVSRVTACGADCVCDAPMKNHTTFHIGGPADYYITACSVMQLENILSLCRELSIDYMIIGNGSNLLICDEGLRKAVIRLGGEFKDISVSENKITCGAGTTLSKLCSVAHGSSLSGLEFAFGIPGTVGGAVFMNAGAYGGEMRDVLTTVTHLTPEGKVETVPADTLELSYRHSVYKSNDCIILKAEFSLTPDDKDEIKARMDDFMNRRITKQPLEFPSAGSVFKRPEGAFAGALIEQCGLKGTCVGGAQVSEKHSGFIVNIGNATCKDVMDLVALVQKKVKDETGYTLEREIIHLK
ncbi:MAG: UDP-N-acetylmuramate dehydrogenase [Ruminococcus sp.]|nr:UDP-N-acetylmuramate dehydrogenase [Ruminococcus sp.]